MGRLGIEITELVIKHYPLAVKGDAKQIAHASSELAVCLGGLLAFAYRFGGETGALQAVQLMLQKIVENAMAIDANAAAIIRNAVGMSNTTEH